MVAKRYTQAQVLYGLREAWEVATGTDEPFDAETQIYAYMMADGAWDDLDLADICFRLEQFFGFKCTREEWWEFFRFDVGKRSREEWEQTVAPILTFGSLAQFVAQRAPVVASFEPIPVFGRNCPTAGVFSGIQRVADTVKCDGQQFAPSTGIFDVMRGRDLDKFWTHLRWMTEHAMPELPKSWRDVIFVTSSLAGLLLLGGLIAAWATSNPIWIAASLISAVALSVGGCIYKGCTNPLPSQIESFRDLSMVIAESRNKMREKNQG